MESRRVRRRHGFMMKEAITLCCGFIFLFSLFAVLSSSSYRRSVRLGVRSLMATDPHSQAWAWRGASHAVKLRHCSSKSLLNEWRMLAGSAKKWWQKKTRAAGRGWCAVCVRSVGVRGGRLRTPSAAHRVAVAARRRKLVGGPGSYPPRCTGKCDDCTPCNPVHVAVPPGTPVTTEYYPEAWRCKCGNKLYMP
ncbi:uncharacterized protein LOC135636005 isoform X1 [Musa acuminata AAA Group]|uniref:uncharacterized protein LOC135636005 isoform X1 n=1 Tax=Musa acuminata AAA Group TaxID=214697 RepID=UPI0031D504DB